MRIWDGDGGSFTTPNYQKHAVERKILRHPRSDDAPRALQDRGDPAVARQTPRIAEPLLSARHFSHSSPVITLLDRFVAFYLLRCVVSQPRNSFGFLPRSPTDASPSRPLIEASDNLPARTRSTSPARCNRSLHPISNSNDLKMYPRYLPTGSSMRMALLWTSQRSWISAKTRR